MFICANCKMDFVPKKVMPTNLDRPFCNRMCFYEWMRNNYISESVKSRMERYKLPEGKGNQLIEIDYNLITSLKLQRRYSEARQILSMFYNNKKENRIQLEKETACERNKKLKLKLHNMSRCVNCLKVKYVGRKLRCKDCVNHFKELTLCKQEQTKRRGKK